MDFSYYPELKKILFKEYGEHYTKYPFVFLAIDFLAQLRAIHDHPSELGGGRDPRFEAHYIEKLISTTWYQALYQGYLNIASYIFNPSTKFTIHSALVEEKYPGLNLIIKNVGKNNSWNTIFQAEHFFSEIWNTLLLKKISPYRSFVSSRSRILLGKFNTDYGDDWVQGLDDETFMEALDLSLRNDVMYTRRLVKRLGINLFINSGDSSANARILVEACKSINVQIITFAHGYIQQTTLVGIAPIHSEKLILWTQKQVSDIAKYLTESEVEKITCIGFPKDYS